MDAYPRTVRELLSEGVQFTVPPFQRPYVWSEDDWCRLWDDVVDLGVPTMKV